MVIKIIYFYEPLISHRTPFTSAREHKLGQRPGPVANGSNMMEIIKVEKLLKHSDTL